jgi:glycosyltransferase involved in cell wall biosynthesis
MSLKLHGHNSAVFYCFIGFPQKTKKGKSMSDNPAVSVIIPVYKVEKYLARCLDSVLAQTFKDFEIICVNDGSPDNCATILANYAQKDKRVKIINQANQGQSVARNSGLKLAKGQFICFVDSDDFIHPQLLEITCHFIKTHNADWVTFTHDKTINNAFKKANNDPRFVYCPPLYKNISDIPYKITNNPLFLFKKNLFYKMTFYVWARLYRRDLLDGIEFLPDNCFEDDPFIMAICKKHPKTVLLKEALYYYIDNQESVSNKTKIEVLPKHIEDYHKSIVYMWEQYKNAPKKDFDFVAKEVVAKKLWIHYNKIKKAEKGKQAELYKVFTAELLDLKSKNFLRFSFNPRKLFYYLKYKKLIKVCEKHA